MLNPGKNDYLTTISQDSDIGNLLRCYWHPIDCSSNLKNGGILKKELLEESFVIFRSEAGEPGILPVHCAHRGADLSQGFVEGEGLRCPYHGWKFGTEGTCLDIPFGPGKDFQKRASLCFGKIMEYGGLIFVYIGKSPPPALPIIDALTFNCKKTLKYAIVPCNWLQIMENSFDPVHLEWLHGKTHNYHHQNNPENLYKVGEHDEIEFVRTEFGFCKKRVLKGQPKTDDDWVDGQHLFFPNFIRVTKYPKVTLHYKVPLARNKTLYLWYECDISAQAPDNDTLIQEEIIFKDADGKFTATSFESEDIIVLTGQGEIADRSTEMLYWIDKGIIKYRNLLVEEAKKVVNGETPLFCLAANNKEVFHFPIIRRENSRSVLE